MTEALVYTAFALFLLVHIWGVVSFMVYLKKIHLEQCDYIYQALKKIDPTIPGPKQVMQKAEKAKIRKKLGSFVPSRDMDYVMGGKKIDPFDGGA